jgi:hypothetical protein
MILVPEASATPAQHESHQQPAPDEPSGAAMPQHMHQVDDDAGPAMPRSRDGSGTSWLPDESPMYAYHAQAGTWMLMAHGNAFVEYLAEGGNRGEDQFGSINWFMGMADRPIGNGHFGVRGMLSLEPWTVRGCGYPDLLASGEMCGGSAIHDRQHPHDLVMELAASYDHALANGLRWQIYGGPAGEPALGPTAFPHRVSAMPSPIAPVTHHWFDSTHITYGVITAGVYGGPWKIEGSLFNGREPDENRTTLDFGALDSWSTRVWFLPTRRWSLQVSGGRLNEAEAGHDDEPRVDVTRISASATYHRLLDANGVWASTIGWGQNREQDGEITNAVLAETNLTIRDRDSVFGRVEVSEKSGHDLAVAAHGAFTVTKLTGGYTRYFGDRVRLGLGGGLSLAVVPRELESEYGGRVNPGVAVFATVRPPARRM